MGACLKLGVIIVKLNVLIKGTNECLSMSKRTNVIKDMNEECVNKI